MYKQPDLSNTLFSKKVIHNWLRLLLRVSRLRIKHKFETGVECVMVQQLEHTFIPNALPKQETATSTLKHELLYIT